MALGLTPQQIVDTGEHPLLVKAAHWERVFLKEIASVQNGAAFSSSYFTDDDGLPLIRIRDVGQKETENFYNGPYSPEYIVNSGDLLIGMDGDFRCAYWTGGKALLNQRVCRVRLKSDLMEEEFLYFCLQPYLDAIHAHTSSVTVKHLSSRTVENIPLPLPPLGEQKRIVAKIEELFSELDGSVANLETARARLQAYRQSLLKHAFEGRLTEQWRRDHADELESADQLLERIREERQARYQQQLEDWKAQVAQWEADGKPKKKPRKPKEPKELPAFEGEELGVLPSVPESWKFVRLGTIAQIGSGMAVSKSRKLEDPVEVPYLRVANVQRGKLDLDEVKTMEVERSELESLRLRKWDVLFNEGGDRDKLGRGWVWESQIEPCITQNHVFRASPWLDDELHSKFISYWGNAFGRDYFEKAGKQTTNLASINKTVLSMFPVPVPPPEEQRKIVHLLEETAIRIDALEKEISDAMEREQVFRRSILKRAFEGRLLLQDPDDGPAADLLARFRGEASGVRESEKTV